MFAKGGRGWLKKKRRKRVLLAWEYGAGRTHYANLLAVARHLKASGIECLATLHDNSAADAEFAAIGVHTLQNFIWPSQRRWRSRWNEIAKNSFTDFLANIGMNSSAAVAAVVAHYDTLFSLFQPDLVLCDQAFGAILAGRERMPVVAMGFCVRLPPIVNGGFPVYPGRTEPAIPVDELLSNINRGLAQVGRFPLRDIADILRIDAVMPSGPAEFDFYPEYRSEPLLPPIVPGLRDAYPSREGNEIFVYLHGFVQSHAAIMDALAALAGGEMQVRAYIPHITDRARKILVNVAIEDRPVPVKDIFARSRVVVHHGGEQLTSACLAVGIPQVIVGKESDNRVNGTYVKNIDLGEYCWYADATKEWIVEAVGRCLHDDALRARCRAAAATYRKWFETEPSEIIAARICQLLGVSFRAAPSAATG
jgi:hypothetical protein